MQVPVVMTTSLGQKISTVAVQQPAGTTAAAGQTTLLTNTSAIGAAAGNTNSQQKVCKSKNPSKLENCLCNDAKQSLEMCL